MADRRDTERDTTRGTAAGAPPIGTAGAPLGSRAGAATSGTEGAYTGAHPGDRTSTYSATPAAGRRGGMTRWIWIALAVVVAVLLLLWLFGGNEPEVVEGVDAPVVEPVVPVPAD